MRRPERSCRQQWLAGLQQAQRAVDAGRLDRLGGRQWRQDRRNPLREHRLAAARRADHDAVVTARCRHADGSLRGLLPAHVGEVDVVGGEPLEPLAHPRRGGGDLQVAREEPHRLPERRNGNHVDVLDHGGLGRARGRHDDSLERPMLRPSLPCRGDRDRQGPACGPRRSLERQFTDHRVILQPLRRKLSAPGEDAEGDRQVEGGRLLRQLRRGEVDDDPVVRPVEARVDHRPGDAVRALADRGVRQPHEHGRRQGPSGNVHLHIDGHRIDPEQGERLEPREHDSSFLGLFSLGLVSCVRHQAVAACGRGPQPCLGAAIAERVYARSVFVQAA